MLKLDAVESGNAPQVLVVLTTRTVTIDVKGFARAKEQLFRALRRRWPHLEYGWCIEFTTGYAATSGGERRPHWNFLLKGGPQAADVWVIRELVNRIWCGNVDAEPQGQCVKTLYDAGGLIGYITNHFQKASQRPPQGFSGHRFGCSRGYFGPGVTSHAQRMHARGSRQLSREFWQAQRQGLQGWAALRRAEAQCAENARRVWVRCNRWGVRLGEPTLNPRRMVLAIDRRRYDHVYRRQGELSALARLTSVALRQPVRTRGGWAAAHSPLLMRT
jgi:hypothetical protein